MRTTFTLTLIILSCLIFNSSAVSSTTEKLKHVQSVASGFSEDAKRAISSMQPSPVHAIHFQRVYSAIAKGQGNGQIWLDPDVSGMDFRKLANNTALPVPLTEEELQVTNMYKAVNCINSQYQAKDMTWAAAMSDEPGSLKVVGSWWTSKQRRVPLTVVTQSTVDRIPQLYAQCASWRGPMSVVLFRGLVQDTAGQLTADSKAILQKDMMDVSAFFEEVERTADMCMPDIMLVYEMYTEEQARLLYPINLLRNLARVQARTPMLAFLDVDMLISRNLYVELLSPVVQKTMVQATQSKSVYVLPAFETYGLQASEAAAIADVLVTQDKDFLIAAVHKGIAAPFDSKRFILGHNATNFNRWYRTRNDYNITYGTRYEPWVIVDRHNVPWHDVRFRGYGNNKIQQIAHINASHFQFIVHHGAFIVHRAHQETSMRGEIIIGKQEYDKAVAENRPVNTSTIYGHTRWLFDEAKEAMNRGKFNAVVDPATRECHAALSWWRISRRRMRATGGPYARSLQHGALQGSMVGVLPPRHTRHRHSRQYTRKALQ